MRKQVATLLTVAFLISISLTANAAVKPGTSCKKLGQVTISSGKKYTCVQSGKKLVWSKGVATKLEVSPSHSNINWIASNKSLLDPSKNCEISRPSNYLEGSHGYGFPRGENFLPNKGLIRGLIISVSFKDAAATESTISNAEQYITTFKKYWAYMSQSAVEFNFDILPEWLALPKTSYEYSGEANYENDKFVPYAQEIIDKTDSFVDFSQYKIVYIIPTDNVGKFFSVGPVLSSGKTNFFKSNDGDINNLVIGTKPEISMGGIKWMWLAHETGHLFGFSHPHSFENNDKKLASIFSLMDSGFVAPGLYGIERWIAGWVLNYQIRCINAQKDRVFKLIHAIEPLGSGKNEEIVAIRISENRVLIAENRKSNYFDKLPSNYEGLLVYEVNSERANGPVKPILSNRFEIDQSKPNYNGSRVVGTLRVGESVTFEGIQISVLQKENATLIVRTERK